MLGLDFFKKKEKKTTIKQSPIDAVVTNLDVALRSDFSPDGHFCSFTFIDERPSFPRVKRTLKQLGTHDGVYVVNHKYSYQEITDTTDLSGLEILKH
jgi:hypothetical protein|tara:strand:- start:542 stop:832 length:291 start_codon:yes stop_codon:yes gene_type:complete